MCNIQCQVCGNDARDFPMKIWCRNHANICCDCVQMFNKNKTHPLAILLPEQTFILCPMCPDDSGNFMCVGFLAGDAERNLTK